MILLGLPSDEAFIHHYVDNVLMADSVPRALLTR